MSLADRSHAGLFLGLWGVMQALAQGVGTVFGGLARDLAQRSTGSVVLGYTLVYAAALVSLVLALGVLFALRLNRQIRAGAVRSPSGRLAGHSSGPDYLLMWFSMQQGRSGCHLNTGSRKTHTCCAPA